mmetsp:Transcript_5632/g.8672  ORF Transcript_5632/g.8672 Transcript_5632/m.8672 type:complete len:442 (+) Transcript_5632:242-1567(+)|eukprot:CAMPEP_0195298908 /NCGR_PEP_ID=MMETSP0707-20130614/24456_1 /TAXON_ID=33640 /ORGANISM="Asterionellopsis glacialis, Strain CCMP134" /LENGTH=441 /DNA_ID=CAMNT_0040361157 /DNA_START=235 /DNA_END=1560 /DNA_ORIENTATION=+
MSSAGESGPDFPESQQKILLATSLVTASTSFLSGCYMVVQILRSREKRQRMYQRLMVGISLNVMLYAAFQFWGVSAVPADTVGVVGAKGTVNTCSALGFLNQFGYVVPSYYASLSLYAYLAVKNSFQEEKYNWIEKWIHIHVYFYPLLSGSYLLYKEAFNYAGHSSCWIASIPKGCGLNSDPYVPCDRGPENIDSLTWVFAGFPLFFFLFFATAMMIVLYVTVRRKLIPNEALVGKKKLFEKARNAKAKSIAKQASLYVASFYFTYTFGFLNGYLFLATGKSPFPMTVVAVNVQNLQGLWIMLVYLRLQLKPSTSRPTRKENRTETEGSLQDKELRSRESFTYKFQLPLERAAEETDETTLDRFEAHSKEISSSQHGKQEQNKDSSLSLHFDPDTFSIFDGSDKKKVSSRWSEFIFDEESNDSGAEEDRLEAMRSQDIRQS